ncbi:hypothetical protein [Xanthomonas melonis]|uniref:hypothetical protein n=1 Tax=Xanthomonas melonis TaxID=56456 RepID=UPI003EB87243
MRSSLHIDRPSGLPHAWLPECDHQFFVARLIRLHPLVVAGAVLGVSSYLFDPFAGTSQSSPLALVLAAFALCLLVLPAPILDNRWHDTHPINSPSWSLLQEYIANIAYALVLRFLSVRALCIVASVAWVALAGGALTAGSLDIGYGWDNLWGAPLRLVYPFPWACSSIGCSTGLRACAWVWFRCPSS